jgi:hypothetical protein
MCCKNVSCVIKTCFTDTQANTNSKLGKVENYTRNCEIGK